MASNEFDTLLESIVLRLVSSGHASPKDIVGCSAQEVKAIEKAQGVKVPAFYRRFLRKMGKGAGGFLQHSEFLYPALLTLKNRAREWEQENSPTFSLPQDAFVFMFHQTGDKFAYIRTDNGSNDPPVYMVKNARRPPVEVSETLSQFFADSVALFVQYVNVEE